MDSEEYLKLFYYQKAMQSIIDFTERYNIPLGSPTIETKGILETIENNEESIMNYYQTGFFSSNVGPRKIRLRHEILNILTLFSKNLLKIIRN
jgi:hypothetical protein